MKSKTLGLFSLSVLSLIIFMSLASADILYNPIELIGSADSGTTATIGFNIENDHVGDLDTITAVFTDLTKDSVIIAKTNLEILGLSTLIVEGGGNEDVTLNITIPSGQEIGLYEGSVELFGSIGGGSEDISRGTLNISLTVTEPEPEGIGEFCEYDDGVSENPGDLRIKIDDITNNGITNLGIHKKFGDDEEWFPFEKIEVEVEVETKDFDVDDISIEWGLYNKDTEEWTIEVDEEDEINLNDDDEEKITFTFEIDENMDEDLDELNGGDFVLYVRATGTIDDKDSSNDGDDTCISDSEEIEMIIESDFVILNEIEFQEIVQCGSDVQITADVWNIGDDDQEDVYVRIYNEELGINEKVEIGDIDAFEDEKLDAVIKIPEDAGEKPYNLMFWVYDEDDDIYETDHDDDESKFNLGLRIEGSCSVESTAVVSASLESGGKAGEELVIKALVTNTGDELAIYSLSMTEYADWASLSSIEPNTVVLAAGESKEVLVTFNVNKEASGDKLFNLIATADDQEIVKQPVSVSIEESAQSGLPGITGNVFAGDNLYLWGIGILNIILIIIIIIVAVRVARK